MEVLRPFRYWTLQITNSHPVTLHHIITLYNDMFNHLDAIICALVKKNPQWKEAVYFAMNFAWQKLSKYYPEVTPTTGILIFSAHMFDSLWKLLAFWKRDKGMNLNHEDRIS
jgi:hypothetical protein